jgi:hypothetical protein
MPARLGGRVLGVDARTATTIRRSSTTCARSARRQAQLIPDGSARDTQSQCSASDTE